MRFDVIFFMTTVIFCIFLKYIFLLIATETPFTVNRKARFLSQFLQRQLPLVAILAWNQLPLIAPDATRVPLIATYATRLPLIATYTTRLPLIATYATRVPLIATETPPSVCLSAAFPPRCLQGFCPSWRTS